MPNQIQLKAEDFDLSNLITPAQTGLTREDFVSDEAFNKWSSTPKEPAATNPSVGNFELKAEDFDSSNLLTPAEDILPTGPDDIQLKLGRPTLGKRAANFYNAESSGAVGEPKPGVIGNTLKSIALGAAKGWNSAAGTADLMTSGAAALMAKALGNQDAYDRIGDQINREQAESQARGEALQKEIPYEVAGAIAENTLDPISIASYAVGGPITKNAIAGATKGATKFGAGLLTKGGTKITEVAAPIAKQLGTYIPSTSASIAAALREPISATVATALNAPRIANITGKAVTKTGELINKAADIPMGAVRDATTEGVAKLTNWGLAKAATNIAGLPATVTEEGDKTKKGRIYSVDLE